MISKDANLKISKKDISTMVSSENDNIIFYSKVDIENDQFEDDESLQISIKEVTKLQKLFLCIPEEEFDIDVEVNHFKYTSPSVRFKYFFLEDGVIKDPKFNFEKFNQVKMDHSFTLTKEKIKEILRMGAIVNDASKVYIKFLNNGVYAETTDKTLEDTNSVDILLSEDYDGVENPIGFPIEYALIKILNYSKCDMFEVKYSSERKVFEFTGKRNKYICKYITSALKN